MTTNYLHGIEAIELSDGTRPVRTVRSSVIGIVGTAPDADADAFPIDTPVLIAGRRSEGAGLDALGDGAGTLPAAIDGVFDQAGTSIIVVRVAEGADAAGTLANVIGGVGGDGSYGGIQALLAAEQAVGIQPRLLIAPGFSQNAACATDLIAAADRLRAATFLDGPNTTDAEAKTYRDNFGSDRAMLIDPFVEVFDTASASTVTQPSSARLAGVQARVDNENGFWWSCDNQLINGITGLARPIDFTHGDSNSRANLLNEDEITTIIRSEGFRVWGARSLTNDPLNAFLSVRRTIDMITESAIRAHRWATGRPMSVQLILDVRNSIQGYLDLMKLRGAILGGEAWIDEGVNAEAALKAGNLFVDFDIEPPAPLERLTFRVRRNGAYYDELIQQVAQAA